MHFIRRAALRAAASSSPSTAIISKARSLNTASPFALKRSAVKAQTSSITSSLSFRRFNSNEASEKKENGVESADHGSASLGEAIDSAKETASEYVGQIKESVEEAVGAATGGYTPREPRERSGGYGSDRPSRGNDRGSFGDRPAFENPPPTNGIYIGNLVFDVTAKDLEKEFGNFGKITRATIAADARGLSKGFGYVEFDSVDSAKAAIDAKHQTDMEGRRLVVNFMKRNSRPERPESDPSKTLFIGNLAFEMSDADLNKLFRDIKNVIDVRVAIDRRTGQPRGFAHADFVDVESAVKAKEQLLGKEVYGRALRIDYSQGSSNRAQRSGGFSDDRGGRGGDRGGYGGDRGGRGGDRGGRSSF